MKANEKMTLDSIKRCRTQMLFAGLIEKKRSTIKDGVKSDNRLVFTNFKNKSQRSNKGSQETTLV